MLCVDSVETMPVRVQKHCIGADSPLSRATFYFQFTHSSVIYVIQKQHQTSVDAVAATLTHKLVGVGPNNTTHVAVRK